MQGDVQLRSLEAGHEPAIRALFRSTIVLGNPLPFHLTDYERYEALCLDRYLEPAERQHSAVLVDGRGGGGAADGGWGSDGRGGGGAADGGWGSEGRGGGGAADGGWGSEGQRVVGYVLVCVDQQAYDRWSRRAASAWTAVTVAKLAARRYDEQEARFHRLRLRDGFRAWRSGPPAPMPAHAHFNLASSVRGRMLVRRLVAHIDNACERLGLPGWFGEINALGGRRAALWEAEGARVIHRLPNLTLSWLCGRPVERLTVARPLALT